MPRNGSGVYSLPPGLPVNGEQSNATDDIRTPFSDLEADMNTARPIVAGGTGATSAAAALVNLGLTATAAEINVLDGITASTAELNILDGVLSTAAQLNSVPLLAGRNRIINGQGRINQRGYVSGTATTSANQYTLDRWRVVVSGQNLTFVGTDAFRTMTAPAGGVEQVIEGANIEGGTYVINWTGTATCTVNGTSRTAGEFFALPANTNATVRFTGGTFTNAQLELGGIATAFERLHISQELANCQRYFVAETLATAAFGRDTAAGRPSTVVVTLPVTMRVVPTITMVNTGGVGPQVASPTARALVVVASTSLGDVAALVSYTASAEL